MSFVRFVPIAGLQTAIQTIERSKFIATILHTPTVDEAQRFFKEIDKQYHDATHNCKAMSISGVEWGSDDGEPSGTAGRPMLKVLTSFLYNDTPIDEVSVVVTRYFGGVKLGTGGLVRAYSSTVKLCLDEAKFIEKRPMLTVAIVASYKNFDRVKRTIEHFDATILEATHSDVARLSVQIEAGKSADFEAAVTPFVDLYRIEDGGGSSILNFLG